MKYLVLDHATLIGRNNILYIQKCILKLEIFKKMLKIPKKSPLPLFFPSFGVFVQSNPPNYYFSFASIQSYPQYLHFYYRTT